jgi:hypothetical protein
MPKRRIFADALHGETVQEEGEDVCSELGDGDSMKGKSVDVAVSRV